MTSPREGYEPVVQRVGVLDETPAIGPLGKGNVWPAHRFAAFELQSSRGARIVHWPNETAREIPFPLYELVLVSGVRVVKGSGVRILNEKLLDLRPVYLGDWVFPAINEILCPYIRLVRTQRGRMESHYLFCILWAALHPAMQRREQTLGVF